MTDLASITKLNCRAFPPESGSVYLDVSSFVMLGWSVSLMRRSHLTHVLPSKPGRNRRSGYPLDGRRASPLNAQTRSASSQALSIGMLRDILAESAPSAKNQVACRCTPTSRRTVASGTPVHSPLHVSPSTTCAVMCGVGARKAARPLPEHSRKWMRDTLGNRFRSSSVNVIGRSTSPWITSLCFDGSIAGMPEWCRSNIRSLGVIAPVS